MLLLSFHIQSQIWNPFVPCYVFKIFIFAFKIVPWIKSRLKSIHCKIYFTLQKERSVWNPSESCKYCSWIHPWISSWKEFFGSWFPSHLLNWSQIERQNSIKSRVTAKEKRVWWWKIDKKMGKSDGSKFDATLLGKGNFVTKCNFPPSTGL